MYHGWKAEKRKSEMKTIFLLPWQFMKKNKGQTFSLFLSMMLSVAMIVAVSCLMYSAHVNKTESIRQRNGDYHYYLPCKAGTHADIAENCVTSGYEITDLCVRDLKGSIDATDNINIVLNYADADCRKMIVRDIIDGKYPENDNEIALDRYTLRLIGAEDEIGGKVNIGGKSFILSGIINDPNEYSGSTCDAYVSKSYPVGSGVEILYLKFNENKDLFRQLVSFTETIGIEKEYLESNGELIDCVIDGNITRMFNTVRSVTEDEEANFTTLLMRLEEDVHLTSGMVSFMLGVFSILIIYSIFSVSLSKRMKEYSILQTIGISRWMIDLMLMIELTLIMLASYPLGAVSGIYFDKLLFEKVSTLFSGRASLIEKTHTGASSIPYVTEAANKEIFCVDKSALISCAVLMFVLIVVICLIISAKIEKKTIVEMKRGEKEHYREKIYSTGRRSLLGVLTDRFMFAAPAKFIVIVLSLSVSGILILATDHIASNTRMNNVMAMHSQDGLSCDIKVSVGREGYFDEGISEEQSEQIKGLDGVDSVSGFKYALGEIPVLKDQLRWKSFWPEIAHEDGWEQSAEIMERFNGIVTENETGYKIKTNIYGYDDESLDMLSDYVLDGSIDKEKMLSENGIILRALTDAQNNNDGLDIKVGDTIDLKTIKNLRGSKELMRFDSDDRDYQEKKYKVMAIVSGSVVSNTEYIGSEGLDVILTNEQMSGDLMIGNYNILTVNKSGQDEAETAGKIQSILSGNDNIKIIDNALSIKAKNDEVKRAEALLYGIAILLVIIAVFNIINTIFHLLNAKRYSFAVLRAMGITEASFYRMLIMEALKYAAVTDVVIAGIFLGIVQPMVSSMLSHVYGYINNIQSVSPGLILLVFVYVAVIFAVTVTVIAGKMLNLKVTNELKTK